MFCSLESMMNIFLVLKQGMLEYLPEGTLELLVPHAVDEGVHSWRHHCVQKWHHQVQGWGGDGGRLQVGKHASADQQGEHSKVREARIRQSIREQEEKEEQLQKAETVELKKVAKLYKEKIQQEKRVAREVARKEKEKEKEKAKKAAQRAAQKSVRNAEKALQLSQKGKRKASQAPWQSRKRQKHVVDALDTGEALVGVSTTPVISTRRGRSIKLSDRHK